MKKTKVRIGISFALALALCLPLLLFFGGNMSAKFESLTPASSQNVQVEIPQKNSRSFDRRYSVAEIREMLGPQPTQFIREYNEFGNVKTTEVLFDENEIAALASVEPLGSLPFNLTTLVNSGKSDSESIVIVFMGEGFTASQQGNWPNPASGTFLFQAASAAATLISTHPYSLFADYFTVYALQVISQDSGVTGMGNTAVEIAAGTHYRANTYFNVSFTAPSSLDISAVDRANALSLAETVSSSRDLVQIIINANYHGGVAWVSWGTGLAVQLALTATQMSGSNTWSPPWHGTVLHEFGHAFGRLVDEHDTGTRTEVAANSTKTTSAASIKWKHWLPENAGVETGIQIFTFADGWAVPAFVSPTAGQSGCIMRASWGARNYCHVCAADLTRRMALIANELYSSKSPSTNDAMPSATSITVPSNATRVLNYAFNGNTNLNTITIPSSVVMIGQFAFLGATGLRTVIVNRAVPMAINATTFAGVNRSLVTLRIPGGTSAAYIAAGWTGFNIQETTTMVATITGLTAVNRQYDGTTVVRLSGGTLSGVYPEHDVQIPAYASIAAASAGDNKPVIGIVLGGADAKLYAFTAPSLTVNIAKREIGLSSLVAADKPYDGTNIANITNASFSNVAALPQTEQQPTLDDLSISAVAFSQANVGSNLTVTYTVSLAPTERAANFTLVGNNPSVTASITQREISLLDITAADKEYDGTRAANVNNATFSNIAGLAVNLVPALGADFTIDATFDNANAGSRTVSISTISWKDTAITRNFKLVGASPTTQAVINQREISIKTITALNKVFDGTASAVVQDVTFSNIDDLPLAAVPTFADIDIVAAFAQANAGDVIRVSVVSASMKSMLGNFILKTDWPTTTANITKRSMALNAVTAGDKQYDGTTAAVLRTVTWTTASLTGLFEGFIPTVADLNITASFSRADVGNNLQVTYTASMGSTLLASNFTLNTTTLPSVRAAITQRQIDFASVGVADKQYDGSTTAEVRSFAWTNVEGLTVFPALGTEFTMAATFGQANAGNNIAVNTSVTWLNTTLARNFAFGGTNPATTANINKREICLDTIQVANKAYDGNETAEVAAVQFTNVASLANKPVLSDIIVTAAFEQSNFGSNLNVTITGARMGATDRAANFILVGPFPSAKANITKREIAITEFSVANKVYDGTDTSTILEVIFSNVEELSSTLLPNAGRDFYITAKFNDVNAGARTVSINSVSWESTTIANNFTLLGTRPDTVATIAPMEVNLGSVMVNDKVYDGTTSATVSAVTFSNVQTLLEENRPTLADVSITATFSKADVGSGLIVSYVATISAHTGNFTLGEARPAATASITKRKIELSEITAAGKVYDGEVTATVNGVVFANIAGVAPELGKDFSIVAKFNNSNAGNQTVTIEEVVWGITPTANNFILGNTVWPSASATIEKREINLAKIIAQNKVYDGKADASIIDIEFTNIDDLREAAQPVLTDINIFAIFAQSNVGDDLLVTIISASLLSNSRANNFKLSMAYLPKAHASITPRQIGLFSISADNKAYDGTRTASLSDVRFTNVDALDMAVRPTKADLNVSAMFSQADVGSGLEVTISSVSLNSGLHSANFTLSGVWPTTAANIVKREISFNTVTSANKLFDGNNSATVINVTFTNITGVSSEFIPLLNVDFSILANFSQSNAGNGIVVTISSVNWLNTLRAKNFTLIGPPYPTTVANIVNGEAIVATITGLAAVDRQYDGTAVVLLSGGILEGIQSGHDVRVPTQAYVSSAGVGSNKAVLGIVLVGADAYLYEFTAPALTISITPREISIGRISVHSKVFDGTSEVFGYSLTFENIEALPVSLRPQISDINIAMVFEHINVGNGVKVLIKSASLRASASVNFKLVGEWPTGTANITPREISLSTIYASHKTYDGTNVATVTNALFTNLDGVPADAYPRFSDLNIVAFFAQSNVDSGVVVSISSATLDSVNYNFSLGDERPTTKANITKRVIALSEITANDKVFDGTNHVQITGAVFTNIYGSALIPVLGVDFAITAQLSSVNVGERSVIVTNVSWFDTAVARNYLFERSDSLPKPITVNVLRAERTDVIMPSLDDIVFDFGLMISDISLPSPWQWKTADKELLPDRYTLQIELPGGENFFDVVAEVAFKVKHRAPTITLEGTIVVWQDMPNNTGYEIYINGELVYTASAGATQFDLATLDISVDFSTAAIQMKTLGEDGLSSQLSELPNGPDTPRNAAFLVLLAVGFVIALCYCILLVNIKNKKTKNKKARIVSGQ